MDIQCMHPYMYTILLIYLYDFSKIQVEAMCNEGNAVDFVPIAEENYFREYVHISNSSDHRPLGFMKGVVRSHDNGQSNPCIRVADAAGRSVEIMFQTIPTTTLCIRESATGSSTCVTGKYNKCLSASSGSNLYEFYCDMAEGCMGSDVDFWYRVVLGPSPESDPEGGWCMSRDSMYPSSLMPLNPNLIPEQQDDGLTDSSSAHEVALTTILTALLLSVIVMLHE